MTSAACSSAYYESCPLPLQVAAAVRANVGIPAGVRIALHITPESIPVRGNASAWGEPEDSRYAAAIEARLAQDDLWAWCMVRVTCTDGDAVGTAYLGGCSYDNTAAFVEHGTGYLHDLVAEAYDEYQGEVARLRAKYATTNETPYV